jgi:hypothetical protein
MWTVTYPFVGIGHAGIRATRCCQDTTGAERISAITYESQCMPDFLATETYILGDTRFQTIYTRLPST